jgi:hypothetical protein
MEEVWFSITGAEKQIYAKIPPSPSPLGYEKSTERVADEEHGNINRE